MTEHESKIHILNTALAVFAEKGFAKASMNDIVRASGLSKGGVYWHFKSKDELIAAIFDQFFVEQLALLDVMLAGEGTAVAKLTQLATMTGQSVAAMASQFPTPLEFYALASREAGLATTLQTHFQSYETKITTLVDQGIAHSEFRSVDSQATAKTIIALFEGMLLIWAIAPEMMNLETQVETAVQLLLQGLQATD
ncbi:MAG: TetR/AcrR family transcriptional regulator [Ardenticatenaceae bacterium]|nr:TetR/AcrR family transcriptional regulator [Ardenticatenaceae bacterium]